MADHAAWLAQVVEATEEPERPIVDPHHHFWRRAYASYAYCPSYLLPELWQDTGSGHRIEQTVFIECAVEYREAGPQAMHPLGETEFVAEIATAAAAGPSGKARIGGIVGHADLRLGAAVEDVLVGQIEAGRGRFRGIRYAAAQDPSDAIRAARKNPPIDVYARTDFREGFARLAGLGLSFDAWHYHPQTPGLTDLARAFPDTTIVLDHFGGVLGVGPYAGRREEILAIWKRDIAALARCPNVVAKLGGLVMPVNGFGWHERDRPATSDEIVAAQRPYYMHTIERFGPDRCMFESNFPVDKCAVSYNVLWNAFKKMAAGFSDDEKDALFRATAMRVYRLDPIT